MTVELLVVLPVVLVIALVAVNGLAFFGECAAFDRMARDAVRLCATSPGYGESLADSAAQVRSLLEEQLQGDGLTCEVAVEQDALGHGLFTLKLTYRPTLFGLGLRDELWGVALPALEHRKTLVVDTYKPGMLF